MTRSTLRVGGVPEHFNSPWKLALKEHAFEAVGLSVSFYEFPTGTGSMCKALRQDEIDVAVVLTEGIISDIVNTGGSRLIAPYVLSPLQWGIFTGAQRDLTLSTLTEPRVAISRFGSGSHLMSFVLAQRENWPQVHFEVTGDIDALSHSVTEATDLFLWEKYTTQSRVDSGQLQRIGIIPTPWPAFMITASEKALAQHRDALKNLLKVIYQYTQSFAKGSLASVAFAAEQYQLDTPVVEQWFSEVAFASDPQLPEEHLQLSLDTLHQLKLIPESTLSEICVQL